MLPDPASRRANQLVLLKERARREYPLLWRKMIADWKSEGADAVWLMYSANYLFCTAGLRWAMDPLSLAARLPGVQAPDYAADLAECSLVVLTHAHADHLDLDLISAISRLPIQWVIPEHTLSAMHVKLNLPSSQIIVPKNGKPIVVGNISLTPFDGLHRRGAHGIQATGYLVEFENQCWLFPGDTRNYDLSLLPSFGRLDGCFAHLWMGKGCAAREIPPLMEEFCNFFTGLHPGKLVITHLNEFGRNEFEMWNEQHYQMIEEMLSGTFQNGNIRSALMGDRVNLDRD